MQNREAIGNIVISKFADRNASQYKWWNTLLRVFIHLFIMLQFPKKEKTYPLQKTLLQHRDNHRLNLNNLYVKLLVPNGIVVRLVLWQLYWYFENWSNYYSENEQSGEVNAYWDLQKAFSICSRYLLFRSFSLACIIALQ